MTQKNTAEHLEMKLALLLSLAEAFREDDSSTSLDIVFIDRVRMDADKRKPDQKIQKPVKRQKEEARKKEIILDDQQRYMELKSIIRDLIKQFLRERSNDTEIRRLMESFSHSGKNVPLEEKTSAGSEKEKGAAKDKEGDLKKNKTTDGQGSGHRTASIIEEIDLKNDKITAISKDNGEIDPKRDKVVLITKDDQEASRDKAAAKGDGHKLAGSFLVSPQPRSFDLNELKTFIASESRTAGSTGPHTPQVEPELLARIAMIPGGFSLFCQVINNLPLIREKIRGRRSIGRIDNVLMYNGESLTDYWGRLKFSRQGDEYVDDTGYFEGRYMDKFEDILEQGKLTDIGFFQGRDITEPDIKSNMISMKLLYNEIAVARGVPLEKLIGERCTLSAVEELVYFSNYSPSRMTESVNVCVCSDSFCKEPCKAIMIVEKRLPES
jgi:hypothetical protein